jgi:hypothetical protein
MSESLINSLNERLSRLERENAELRSEAKKYRQAKSKVGTEAETLRKQVEDLARERDTFKAKAEAMPSDQAKRINELESSIRQRDHKDAFGSVLSGKLADKVTIDDVWQKIGYEPGETVPPADQLAGLVSKARDAAPYLFASDAGQAPGQSAQQNAMAATPPPWSGRGLGQSESPVVFTEAQLRDPVFMLSDQAKKMLATAS